MRLKKDSLLEYFQGTLKNTHLKSATRSAHLRSLLRKFNQETSWPEIPQGPLIIVADGIIQFFEKEKYTLYFFLIRSTTAKKAFILPPYMRKGGEVALGWQEAFALIPPAVLTRIQALVCDGHSGLVYMAKNNNWVLQRCHFHLLARIAHNASFGPLGKNYGVGLRVRNLVQVVLYSVDMQAVTLALEALKRIKVTITSRNFKTVISGFILHYEDYRSYYNFPQHNLPATSNTAESLNALLRNLQYRARGFRTPASFLAWFIGFCKYKKFITCNPKIQPN